MRVSILTVSDSVASQQYQDSSGPAVAGRCRELGWQIVEAAVSLGANRPQDAVYPVDEVDQDGNPLNGANNKYVMHFAKDETPPVNALWSLTIYDTRYFFVANQLNKYIVSLHDALKYNADGSLDVYVQNQSPGAEWEPNWLPAPSDRFILMLRMYSPKERDPSILNGSWKVPAVTPIQ